jgi:hypothetical protein
MKTKNGQWSLFPSVLIVSLSVLWLLGIVVFNLMNSVPAKTPPIPFTFPPPPELLPIPQPETEQ